MARNLRKDNRARLLHAAADLFASQGYHATGMKDLEQATGMGRSSLYHYFSNKEELLFEITTRYLRELVGIGHTLLDEDIEPAKRLRLFSRAVMRSVAEDLAELTVCFREMHSVTGDNQQALMDLHRSYESVWARVLQAGSAAGVFTQTDAITVKSVIGMHHYSYLWLRPEGKRSPESIADSFCDLILDGLTPR
ncbi:TetR/AcrR family transcriptional regulator [Salinisphaera aquimarina]|uniref:TetR/AcrR family transcriptional regulator n=1 Tax=Salinisphaera aquimarina TaxID=2094031 RepID=A0ABV7ERP6_9GAMM